MGDTASARTPAAPSRRRKLIGFVLKIAVGLAIVWVIASKLSLDDEVVLQNEKLRGSELALDRSALGLEFVKPDGTSGRIPLAADPSLLRKEGEVAIKEAHGALVRVREAHYAGSGSIVVGGEARRFDLGEVKLQPGAEVEGWREQMLDLREGLRTIYGRLEVPKYVVALLLILATYAFGILRWQILLAAQGIDVSLWEATRLTFIGFFFNNIVPGLTGGDLVKAILIAKAHPGRGATAVTTVIVDRVLGLLVLAAISAVVLLFNLDKYATVAFWLFLMLGGAVVAICLFLSRRIRRTLKLDQLMRKLPGAETLKQLDQSLLLYRSRGKAILWSVLLSTASHICNVLSVWMMGIDLGVDASAGLEGTPVVTYFAIVPTILIASSVPLLPGGWGLGEALYAYFFRTVGVTNISLSVGLSVLTRASMLFWSLFGGLFLLGHRREASEAFHEAQDLDHAPDLAPKP